LLLFLVVIAASKFTTWTAMRKFSRSILFMDSKNSRFVIGGILPLVLTLVEVEMFHHCYIRMSFPKISWSRGSWRVVPTHTSKSSYLSSLPFQKFKVLAWYAMHTVLNLSSEWCTEISRNFLYFYIFTRFISVLNAFLPFDVTFV